MEALLCMNKMQSIRFEYTSKDVGRKVGFSTSCVMQSQMAVIYAAPLSVYQQMKCACRQRCDTNRKLIPPVVTVDGFSGAFAKL
jgi:hypothetical protein